MICELSLQLFILSKITQDNEQKNYDHRALSKKLLITMAEVRQFIKVATLSTLQAWLYLSNNASLTRFFWLETRGFHGRSFLNWNPLSCLRE